MESDFESIIDGTEQLLNRVDDNICNDTLRCRDYSKDIRNEMTEITSHLIEIKELLIQVVDACNTVLGQHYSREANDESMGD
jgi:hypothetical protein